ncbi:MAG: hypothetical protein NTZ86_08680, partial [Legionellales bacterium]|nr:hypothetical protein [Legionellales bacterium]
GNANHILYWDVMGPKAGGNPTGAISKAIDQSFESFDKLKEKTHQARAKILQKLVDQAQDLNMGYE